MVVTAKKVKRTVRNILLNDETLSSVQMNEFTSGWHSFGIQHIIMDEQAESVDLLMNALYGAEYNRNNVGSFDADKSKVYTANVYKIANDGLIVLHGQMADDANLLPLEVNDDDVWVCGKHKPKFILQTEKMMFDGNIKDVQNPYLSFEIDTPGEDPEGNPIVTQVNFLIPFRLEKYSRLNVEALQTAWLNGEVEDLAELLKTPASGGGGWSSIASLAYTFLKAGLDLPELHFQVIDIALNPDTNGYGESIDAVLHPDWYLPILLSKKGDGSEFIARNVSKIRFASNHPGFAALKPILSNSKMKAMVKDKGCFVKVMGFHLTNKSFFPRHSIQFGQADRLMLPDFEKLLNIVESVEPKAIAGSSEFTQPVQVPVTDTVNVAAKVVTTVDPIDSF